MFDQWRPALDLMDGSTNHSPYPQANQLGAEYLSVGGFLDHNPMISSFLLLPMPVMKAQTADLLQSNVNQNRVVSGQAFTSDGASHQLFNHSFEPLEPTECYHYSPASSPDGSCSDLFGASQPQLLYSSPSNADNSEAISGVGTTIQSKHPRILRHNYSTASEKLFPHHLQAVVTPDQVPASSSVPDFRGLSQSRVLRYPSEIFPATGTMGVSASPVSLMADIFRVESSDHLDESERNYDRFSRTWANNDFDRLHRDAGQFDLIPQTVAPSGYVASNERHNFAGHVPTTKPKRFPCPECGQRFARAFNLQTHIATHAGMRPFSCPADGCSKAFSRRHDLGRHVGAVHRDWLALKNISVQEAVKSLRRTNDASKSQNHYACRKQAKREKESSGKMIYESF